MLVLVRSVRERDGGIAGIGIVDFHIRGIGICGVPFGDLNILDKAQMRRVGHIDIRMLQQKFRKIFVPFSQLLAARSVWHK